MQSGAHGHRARIPTVVGAHVAAPDRQHRRAVRRHPRVPRRPRALGCRPRPRRQRGAPRPAGPGNQQRQHVRPAEPGRRAAGPGRRPLPGRSERPVRRSAGPGRRPVPGRPEHRRRHRQLRQRGPRRRQRQRPERRPPEHARLVNRVDQRFPSMGSTARVTLESEARSEAELERHAAAIRTILEDVEGTLTRFRADSELCRLNADPRRAVPASPLLRHFALAVRSAGARSGGLVDATLVAPLERQGYIASRAGVAPAGLDEALAAAPPRRPARPAPARGSPGGGVDEDGRIVRPPGVRLDSGGIGKGLAADLAAVTLLSGIRFAISCGGDLAVGGAAPPSPWEVAVTSARTGAPVHALRVRGGGVATSGISARLWRRDDGSFAPHLLDPSTGEPAWTGLVAVTALGATTVEAEILAKT